MLIHKQPSLCKCRTPSLPHSCRLERNENRGFQYVYIMVYTVYVLEPKNRLSAPTQPCQDNSWLSHANPDMKKSVSVRKGALPTGLGGVKVSDSGRRPVSAPWLRPPLTEYRKNQEFFRANYPFVRWELPALARGVATLKPHLALLRFKRLACSTPPLLELDRSHRTRG